ncbi:MAG: hypothetical protein ACOX3T_07570 [Bdellovibrionota bacterium]
MDNKFYRFRVPLSFIFSFIFLLLINLIFFPKISYSKEDSDFTVSEKSLYFEKTQKPIRNIVITNQSETTLYIKGEIKKIINDDFFAPEFSETKEVIITPKNASIKPKESLTFRVVYLPTTSQKENQYKLSFTPYNKDFSKPNTKETFDIDVLTDPLIVNDAFSIIRGKKDITFKNSGNRSVYIYDAKSCDSKNCEKLLDIRIPSGTELKLDIERNKTFYGIQKIGTDYKNIKY